MTARTPSFPDTEAFARAFYVEAARHLEDAKVLYEADRSAASITSTMKASELGVKAVVILDNAVGFYEKVFKTHKPLTETANHLILKRIPLEVDKGRKNLTSEIRRLEQLEPTQFGSKSFSTEEANTEYPFLLLTIDASGNEYAELNSPETYFGVVNKGESLRLYQLAHELLELLPKLYPTMATWGIPLPPAL